MVALSYPIRSQQAVPGLAAENLLALTKRSYVNPSKAQVNTATVGGTTTNGEYKIIVTADDIPGDPVFTFTFDRQAAETDTAIATALRDLILADSSVRNLFTASSAAAVVTLTFLVSGLSFTVTQEAPAPGTIVIATTVAAGGTVIPFGTVTAKDTFPTFAGETPAMRVMASGDTVANVAGGLMRHYFQEQNPAGSDDVLPVGKVGSIAEKGLMWMSVNGTITPGPGGTARFLVIDAASGFVPGTFHPVTLGGNSTDISTICTYESNVTTDGLVVVRFNI